MPESCIFCRIIRGDEPALRLVASDDLQVFLSRENHPLIVSTRHVPDLYTLDDATAAAIMPMAKRVARALKAALACEGIYLTQANEPAAGQDVFHFHLHVYPRWRHIPLAAQQTHLGVTEQDRRQLFEQLRRVWDVAREAG